MSQIGVNSIQNSVKPVESGTGLNSKLNPGIGSGPSFGDALQKALHNPALAKTPAIGKEALNPLKFSNHAIDRMRQRGISYSPEQMEKIGSAIEKADAKGAKETLVLTDNSAMIVSVKNNTVVTVMDKVGLKENVFTNIDSTVVI